MAHIPKQAAANNLAAAEAVPTQPQADVKLPYEKEAASQHQSAADAELRNHFASIALKEIIRWQIANGRGAGQEDVAADWAFRYADRLVEKSKKPPSRPSYNAKGVQSAPEPMLPPDVEANMRQTLDEIPGGMIPSK